MNIWNVWIICIIRSAGRRRGRNLTGADINLTPEKLTESLLDFCVFSDCLREDL